MWRIRERKSSAISYKRTTSTMEQYCCWHVADGQVVFCGEIALLDETYHHLIDNMPAAVCTNLIKEKLYRLIWHIVN